MAITALLVESTLKLCIDPNTGKDLISSKSAKNIQVQDNNISLEIVLGYPAHSVLDEIKSLVSQH